MHHFFHATFPAAALAATFAAQAAPMPVTPLPFAPEPVRVFALPASVNPATDGVGLARFGPAAPGEVLASQRGGTDTVNNNMTLGGSVQNNVANNVVTGSNTIDAGSFANMSGIPTVIQNTGANVLIQNATIINLQFK